MTDPSSLLSPELYALLLDFAKAYTEKNPKSINEFVDEFFQDYEPNSRTYKKRNSTADNSQVKSRELLRKINGDPNLLWFRDKMHLLVFRIVVERPKDEVEFIKDFFKEPMADPNKKVTTEKLIQAPKPNVTDASRPSRRAAVAAEVVDTDAVNVSDIEKTFVEKTQSEMTMIQDSVKDMLLFQGLDKEKLAQIAKCMIKANVRKDDFVIRQGDDGDFFYVIIKGKFEAYVTDDEGEKLVKTYDQTGCFGDLALMYNMPRVASVKAATDGSLWALDRDSFRKILVLSAMEQSQVHEEMIGNVPILEALTDDEKKKLADALRVMWFKDGDKIIGQGEEADGMYFVEEGEVICSKKTPKGQVEVNRIGTRGYFGELALINKAPRAVSAFASGTVKVAFLEAEAFERLLGPCIHLMSDRATIMYQRDQLDNISNKPNKSNKS